MAKGARASTRKANNAKLKSRVFGPVETARTARLSAKLLELASRPKAAVVDIKIDSESGALEANADAEEKKHQAEDMNVDLQASKTTPLSTTSAKARITKRARSRKTSIIFAKYRNGRKSRSHNTSAKK